mgnify:CR=1 FL=1
MELYLHIPFCRQKCRYCDFASWSGEDARIGTYLRQLAQEARTRANEIGGQTVDTVFIGGGTPSVIPSDLLTKALGDVFAFFPPAEGAEFTVEANPGTLTAEWLSAIKKAGCNRLSMGLQVIQPQLLTTLGRIHTADAAALSVRMARDAGFDNLNLDLIFGVPGQTMAMWRETLDFALSLKPEHLSCYGLIPEEGTPLMADLEAGRLCLPDEQAERDMYDTAIETLRSAGLGQYEISNFARPGRECRHNIGYWTGVPYLGLGLSAASYLPMDGDTWLRETNPGGWDEYAGIASGCLRRSAETVTPEASQFETMMLGLRMNRGVSEAFFQARHGVTMARWESELNSLQARGLMERVDGAWRLTRRGMDIQNSILVELL